jgi:hypothetical protein
VLPDAPASPDVSSIREAEAETSAPARANESAATNMQTTKHRVIFMLISPIRRAPANTAQCP